MKGGGVDKLLPVIVIAGPTAAAKTEVAIALALQIGAEIISADSRQIYRDLTIGTAKPTVEELACVPHHFIDILPLTAEYSAGQFCREARVKIDELRSKEKNIIIAGGSGLYIDALLNGFFQPVAGNKKLQQELKERARRQGSEALHAELTKVDPERAAELPKLDAHRIVRSLEVYLETGRKHSELLKQPRVAAKFPFRQFAFNWPRQTLYERIEKRVDMMLESGLLDEVDHILHSGVPKTTNALMTVGYREVIQYRDNELTFDEMVDKIKQHTRNYAKRQMTWFRRDSRIKWIDCAPVGVPGVIKSVLAQIL